MSSSNYIVLALCVGMLSGCASYSKQAAEGLDKNHEKYTSQACQEKLATVSTQENIKTTQMILMPTLAIASGGVLALPILATNLTLGYQDNHNSSEIRSSCNANPKTDNEIASDTLMNSLVNVATAGLVKIPVNTSK